MKIESISINNYRSIKKLNMKNLQNVNVFVGENSAGKSTVLNAIQLATNPLREYSQFSEKDIHHGEVKATIQLFFSLNDIFYSRLRNALINVKNVQYLEFVDIYIGDSNKQTDTIIFRRKFKNFVNKELFGFNSNIQKIGIESSICTNEKKEEKVVIRSNGHPIIIEDEKLKKIIIKCILNSPVVIKDERGFFNESTVTRDSISNSVFNIFINTFKSNEGITENIEEKKAKDLTMNEINELMKDRIDKHSSEFLKNINNTFSNYSDDYGVKWEFAESLITPYDFNTAFTDKSKNSINFMSIGSGTRSMYIISLLQAYYNMTLGKDGAVGIFLIEEPELYLYPKLENRMAEILNELAINNQLFITTHSSSIIKNFKKEDIHLVSTEENGSSHSSTFKKLVNHEQIFDVFGFDMSPFYDKKFVVFVEGKKDIDYYKKIYEIKFPKEADKIAFIQTGGIDKIHFGLSCQFIQSTELKNKFIICCDSDNETDEKNKNKIEEQIKLAVGNMKKKNYTNHYYYTEGATNLETIFVTYNRLKENFGDCVDSYIEEFIEENENRIRSSFDNKGLNYGEGWKNNVSKFYDEYRVKSSEENYSFMRRYLFSKSLFSLFKAGLNDNDFFSKLLDVNQYSKKKLREVAPNLIEKFEYINGIISEKM